MLNITINRITFMLALAIIMSLGINASADQKFYIDFDSIEDAFDADPESPFLPPADEIYTYTDGQREFILEYLNTNMAPYGMFFFEGPKPVAFADSSITLNKGFGAGSEGVDFRNEEHDDGASVNTISIFKFLGKTEGEWTDDDVAMATANLAGHEALHLMGGRHHDAWGPLGTGIPGSEKFDFSPPHPGPYLAPETASTFSSLHVGGSLGFESLTTPKVLSERIVPRLEVTKPFSDEFIIEDSGDNHLFDMPQGLGPIDFVAPYPYRPLPDPEDLEEGEPFPVFPTEITGKIQIITGTLSTDTGSGGFASEYYEFDGAAGEIWTIEGMSYILEAGERYIDNADIGMILLDPTGAVIPYNSLAASAITDDDDDSDGKFFGATFFDIILPYSGKYILEIVPAAPFLGPGSAAKDGTDGGSYEIFMYTAKPTPIPEPASFLALGGLLLIGTMRRKTA